MAEFDAEAVAVALAGEPLRVAAATQPEAAGGLPSRPGCYAWWVDEGTLAGVPHHPHPKLAELGLLYVCRQSVSRQRGE